MTKLITTLVSILFLTACTTVPLATPAQDALAKRFFASKGKAAIYIYRNDQFEGGGVLYPITVNGRIIASLKAGTFIVVETNPGSIQIASFTQTQHTTKSIDAHADEIYYFSTAYSASAATIFLGVPG